MSSAEESSMPRVVAVLILFLHFMGLRRPMTCRTCADGGAAT